MLRCVIDGVIGCILLGYVFRCVIDCVFGCVIGWAIDGVLESVLECVIDCVIGVYESLPHLIFQQRHAEVGLGAHRRGAHLGGRYIKGGR